MPQRADDVSEQLFEALESRHLLAGFTLVSLGFQLNGKYPAWVPAMSQAIANEAGTSGVDVAEYKLTLAKDGPYDLYQTKGPALDLAATGEGVVGLDWADLSNNFFFQNDPGDPSGRADVVAQAVVNWLLEPANHFVQLSIHLIGHSRGASVVSEIARMLGEHGIWVDQMTTLDPHPLTFWDLQAEQGEYDPAVQVYENTVFADNYWREDNFSVDIDGEPIDFAHDRKLDEGVLEGGGYDTDYGDSFVGEHSDVHLWYHGTVDQSKDAFDGLKSVPANWYEGDWRQNETDMGPRPENGYYFSRIRGGMRPADGMWLHGGGLGGRVDIERDLNVAQWPNIANLALDDYLITVGGKQYFSFVWDDYDTDGTVSLYLDDDQNPFNDNAFTVKTVDYVGGDGFGSVKNLEWDTTGLDDKPGRYYVGAKITGDDGLARYTYAPKQVEIRTPGWGEWFFDVTYSNPAGAIVNQGDKAFVNVWAKFDETKYAFAGGFFNVDTDEDDFGLWKDIGRDLKGPGTDDGTIHGGDVNGIITGQLQFPLAGIFADTSNPILAWHGTFTTNDLTDHQISLTTASGKFIVYINYDGYSEDFIASLSEAAATIQVGSGGPVMSVTPDEVNIGFPDLEMTVTGVPDNVSKVTFFIDWNDNKDWDKGIDLALGSAVQDGNSWTLVKDVASLWGTDQTTVVAQLIDGANVDRSHYKTIQVNGGGPRVITQDSPPGPLYLGQWLTLTARVQDDEEVAKVTFFYDRDHSGAWSNGDWALGPATYQGDGTWTLDKYLGDVWAGEGGSDQRFIALAYDKQSKVSVRQTNWKLSLSSSVDLRTPSIETDIDTVAIGGTVTITARDIADEYASKVSFFFDWNRNGKYEKLIDFLLGAGEHQANSVEWVLDDRSVGTIWGTGPTALCALIIDDKGQWRGVKPSTLITVTGGAPRIVEVLGAPNPVQLGQTLTLSSRVQDDTGLKKVNFFYDRNGDGKWTPGYGPDGKPWDWALGEGKDDDGDGIWTLAKVLGNGWAKETGWRRFIAQAQDKSGKWNVRVMPTSAVLVRIDPPGRPGDDGPSPDTGRPEDGEFQWLAGADWSSRRESFATDAVIRDRFIASELGGDWLVPLDFLRHAVALVVRAK